MLDSSLILEGGGMRGVYTGGVLEYFMEKNLEFPYIIGVSAGACQAMSYVSKQPGRNKKITIDLVKHPKYIRYRGIIDGTGLFNMNFIFDEIPNQLVHYDYETFRASKQQLIVVATDCKTGKPVYLNCKNGKTNEEINLMVRASSSLPLVAPIVKYKDMELLDGGLVDSIPIQKAIKDGKKKHVVVLTRPSGYRKGKPKGTGIYKMILGKNHAGAYNALKQRYIKYNQTLDELEKLEKEKKVLIIRPSQDLAVKRTERDPNKLEQLYKLGYEDAKNLFNDILNFLQCDM